MSEKSPCFGRGFCFFVNIRTFCAAAAGAVLRRDSIGSPQDAGVLSRAGNAFLIRFWDTPCFYLVEDFVKKTYAGMRCLIQAAYGPSGALPSALFDSARLRMLFYGCRHCDSFGGRVRNDVGYNHRCVCRASVWNNIQPTQHARAAGSQALTMFYDNKKALPLQGNASFSFNQSWSA